ncbi:HNH endonuclease signature motif containing protein [Herbiconiux daphne]|uniref:HNH endonuclease n=1 Tax=Herbiconiux daphne TaxID=2970914 RepID=A0ABT2H204_9MICO|nr:HNH endonuclease signature motif containing protein [Herbiconiux daphne]MCS5733931.1 HNH endonuclease [Herbiconiux daphne]
MNELADRLDSILAELAEVESSIAALAGRRAVLLAEATTVRLAQSRRDQHELAMRSLAAEIGCALHLPGSTATRLLNDAETLTRSLPTTLAALTAGSISYRHAEVLLANARSLPHDARAPFEQALLATAQTETAARLDRVARRERERLHPESIEVRTSTALTERHVTVTPDADGMAWVSGYLPAVAAVAIDERLTRIARAARSRESELSVAQLRADALASLLLGDGRASDEADSSDMTDLSVDSALLHIVPTVVLTVPALSLLGHDAGNADLHGYGPIDIDTARRLAARAPSFIRILTHPDTGETLSVGRERYSPPSDLRLALLLEDETCRFPTCNRRAEACELDHTLGWSRGGATEKVNLHHLCVQHHHVKHDSTGWSVRANHDRTLEWTSPTGRRYSTTPNGRASGGTNSTGPRRPVFTAEPDRDPVHPTRVGA